MDQNVAKMEAVIFLKNKYLNVDLAWTWLNGTPILRSSI